MYSLGPSLVSYQSLFSVGEIVGSVNSRLPYQIAVGRIVCVFLVHDHHHAIFVYITFSRIAFLVKPVTTLMTSMVDFT